MLAWSLTMLAGCGGDTTQTPTEIIIITEAVEPTEVTQPTETVEPTEEATPTEASLPARTLTILTIEGAVQVRTAPDTEWGAASPGQELIVGSELITDTDGQATIQLDDGTTAIILENSSFVVEALEGTPENPIVRFLLNLGEVFSFHQGELSSSASYEIETPNGVAAVRGTMMSVSYDPDTGQVVVTCLEGHCSLSGGGMTVDLIEGEMVIIEGLDLPPGDVSLMTDAELQAWIDVIETLTEEEIDIDAPLDDLLNELEHTLESLQVCVGEGCITDEDLEGLLPCEEGGDCIDSEDVEEVIDCLVEGGEGCIDDVDLGDVIDDIPPIDPGGGGIPGGGGDNGGGGDGGLPWP
jgi:ferric-dicitrate binding protein FerR (iron transport regulator)